MASQTDLPLPFIQGIVENNVLGNYVTFAVLTVLVYDIAISFDKEARYFWNKPRSAVAILYFVNRYGAVLATVLQLFSGSYHANNQMCRLTFPRDILDTISLMCVDYILLLRVLALYMRGKTITIVLTILYILQAAAGLVIVIQGDIFEDPMAAELGPGLIMCGFVNNDPKVETVASWVILMVYGILLLILALYKAREIWKESMGFEGLQLIQVLIRDQALYFSAMIFVGFLEIVQNLVDETSTTSTLLSVIGNPVLLSILGARVLFGMKEAGEKGINQGTSCRAKSTLSGVDFGTPSSTAGEGSLDGLDMEYDNEVEAGCATMERRSGDATGSGTRGGAQKSIE